MRRLIEHPLAAAGAQDGAMTEVALALATGFFSIAILTLISMGGGEARQTSFEAVPVVRTVTDGPATSNAGEGDVIVLFDGARFLDTKMQPVAPGRLEVPEGARLVLAVTPDLAFSQVSDARRAFAARDLVVTTMDERWTAALSNADPEGAR